ncbi:hypothetical protein AB3R30_16160 [Leptolyngbyaceae cyanobacterium UHCC 1019]
MQSQLHTAAIQANERQVLMLIAQIPDAHSALAKQLTDCVNEFCLENIIKVTDPR